MPHAVQRLPISCGSSLGHGEDAFGDRHLRHHVLHSSGSHHGYAAGRSSGTRIGNSGGRCLAERGDTFARVGRGRGGEQQRGVDAVRRRPATRPWSCATRAGGSARPRPARCRATRSRAYSVAAVDDVVGDALHEARRSARHRRGTVRPDISQSSAVGMPTSRGRNHDEHASGTMPRRVNTNPNVALGAAKRASIGSVIDAPTPIAGPFTAAITGLVHSKMRSDDDAARDRGPIRLAAGERPLARPEIGARAERASRAGDDDGAHVGVGVDRDRTRRTARAASRS